MSSKILINKLFKQLLFKYKQLAIFLTICYSNNLKLKWKKNTIIINKIICEDYICIKFIIFLINMNLENVIILCLI